MTVGPPPMSLRADRIEMLKDVLRANTVGLTDVAAHELARKVEEHLFDWEVECGKGVEERGGPTTPLPPGLRDERVGLLIKAMVGHVGGDTQFDFARQLDAELAEWEAGLAVPQDAQRPTTNLMRGLRLTEIRGTLDLMVSGVLQSSTSKDRDHIAQTLEAQLETWENARFPEPPVPPGTRPLPLPPELRRKRARAIRDALEATSIPGADTRSVAIDRAIDQWERQVLAALDADAEVAQTRAAKIMDALEGRPQLTGALVEEMRSRDMRYAGPWKTGTTWERAGLFGSVVAEVRIVAGTYQWGARLSPGATSVGAEVLVSEATPTLADAAQECVRQADFRLVMEGFYLEEGPMPWEKSDDS